MNDAGPGRARTRKRDARRGALLGAAARMINAYGAGAINLNDIAEQVGLSRNALYYYVTDRADLVFQCYRLSCEAALDDLATAYQASDDASERLRRFIDITLAFDRAEVALVSDPDMLPDIQRQLIFDLQQQLLDGLARIVDDGIAACTLRPCNAGLVAQTLAGMLLWEQQAAKWIGRRDGPRGRQRAAAAMHDLLLNGIGTPIAVLPPVPPLVPPSFNAFDRQATADARADQLLAAASRLFNRRGVEGVSLDDIGASVGATKGAIYHYFEDKQALVVRCYVRGYDMYERYQAMASAAGGSGYAQAMTVHHLNSQAQASGLAPLVPQPGLAGLPESARAGIVSRGRAIRVESERKIKLGIADGSCRPCDAAMVAEVSAGTFFSIPKWLPGRDNRSPISLADELADLSGRGIALR